MTTLRPSYRAGFARNAAESANPGLWGQLTCAYMPALGQVMGARGSDFYLPDLSSRKRLFHDFFSTAVWKMTSRGYSIDPNGNEFGTGYQLIDTFGECTVLLWLNWKPTNAWQSQASLGTDGLSVILVRSAGNTNTVGIKVDDRVASQVGVVNLDGFALDAPVAIVVRLSEKNNRVDAWANHLAGADTNLGVNGFAGDTNDGFSLQTDKCHLLGLMTWDRLLDDNECRQIAADPLAQFRLRPLAPLALLSNSPADTDPPTITDRVPADTDTDVAVNTTVQVTFDEDMDEDTINGTTFTLANTGGPVAGVVTYAARVATFTPDADLDNDTSYTVTVAGTVADPAGNTLGTPSVWSFTTVAAPAPGGDAELGNGFVDDYATFDGTQYVRSLANSLES